jgi:hypothetical protein
MNHLSRVGESFADGLANEAPSRAQGKTRPERTPVIEL